MDTIIRKRFTKGDRLVPLSAALVTDAGAAVDLSGTTVTFRMVRPDRTVKIEGTAATIEDAALGHVRYDWAAGDVDEEGVFYAWFIRTVAGASEHFPGQGKFLEIEIAPDP